jgi:hypothetical protein
MIWGYAPSAKPSTLPLSPVVRRGAKDPSEGAGSSAPASLSMVMTIAQYRALAPGRIFFTIC